jgi:hypothetical protein
MINIKSIIESLQSKRKVFHSEDDFKLSLSMEIMGETNCEVRLERPVIIDMIDWNNNIIKTRAPIDIVIIEESGKHIPIELKYKTKKVTLVENNEEYNLTEHGAVDIGRYNFRKDIYRIEQYLSSHKNSSFGYVLILTNDKAYFNSDVSNKNTYDRFLSFHHNAQIKKKDQGWNYSEIDESKYIKKSNDDNRWWYKGINKLHWTCSRERFYKLYLLNDYQITWENYSIMPETNFKYCLIKIEKTW